MTKRTIALIAGAAFLAVVLVMAGCSSGAKVVDEGDKIDAVDDIEARTLYVVESELRSESLDPLTLDSIGGQKAVGPAIESLVTIDTDTGLSVPNLATSWEHNENNTVWTVYLREGVQFHDGWGEMTAEDVKFSIERLIRPDSATVNAIFLAQLIKEVNVLDRYKLEIHLNSPTIDFVPIYLRGGSANSEGMVMSKAYWDAVGDEGFAKHPIGTGRWIFKEFRPGDYIEYEAADEHWSGVLPEFDRLVLMEVPEAGTRAAMLKRGEADIIDVPVDMALNLQEEGYNLLSVKNTVVGSIRFWGNWQQEAKDRNLPITNVKVRKALSLAINREEITKELFGGLFDPWALPGGVAREGAEIDMEKWDPWVKENYRYDPELAKELLAEAGYPDGFEIIMWASDTPRGPWHTQVTEVIASYWQEIGVTANIQYVDHRGVFNPLFRTIPHPPELLGTASVASGGYDREFVSDRVVRQHVPEAYHQLLDHNNERAMNLLDMLRDEQDFDRRKELFEEVLLIIGEEFIAPTLFYGDDLYAMSDKVKEAYTIAGQPIPSLWVYTFKPVK